MRWEHVDLARRVVHPPQINNGHARDVPLSSRAVGLLKSLQRNINGRVFDMRENAVTRVFDRVCKRAGIEGLRLYDLGHEATSHLADKLQMQELAKVMGHRDTRVLIRYTTRGRKIWCGSWAKHCAGLGYRT